MNAETTLSIIESIAVPAASVAAPLIGGPVVEAIILLAAKYGPGVIHGILALLKKKTVTVDDIEAAFAPLKEYEEYGIKDKI